jgi:hypothetical protein
VCGSLALPFPYRCNHLSTQISTGPKNQNSFIFPARHTQYFCQGIDDEAHVSWPSLLRSGMAPPTRRDLASDTWTPHPRSRSASRFRPFYVPSAISFIPIASYYICWFPLLPGMAPNLTQRAKEWLAKTTDNQSLTNTLIKHHNAQNSPIVQG